MPLEERMGMKSSNFVGQVAVVTGAAQGIGQAVARVLNARGATVVGWDLERIDDESTLESCGLSAAFECDISDLQSVESAYRSCRGRFGAPAILVNSAGIAGPNAPLDEYDIEAWHKILAVNLNGTFYTNRVCVAGMKSIGYGRITNIASIAGKEGNPNASAYSASKAGVIGLTKSLGKELAALDIGVNCVTPAAARTRIFDQMAQEHIDYMLAKIPRGRFLEVEEAAEMIAWTVSKENSFTTGATFDLSGGRATY